MKQPVLVSSILTILDFLHKGARQTTSYVPLARTLGVFSGGTALAEALGEVQKLDHLAGRPLRSSLVVGKNTGIPGPGYFVMAHQFHKFGNTAVEEFAFWLQQMDSLGVAPSHESLDYGRDIGYAFDVLRKGARQSRQLV